MALNRAVERALIAGTGSIGRRHLATLRTLRPGLRFAFLRGEPRQDEVALSFGAEIFTDLAAALEWGPDLAVVATPSDRHGEIIGPLLDAGIATFIEKPVVISMDDLLALEQRDPGTLPPTQIGCVLRFFASVAILRAWIADRRLGSLVRARLECGQYLPDWRPGVDYRTSYSADRARGGGVIFDLVHEIDLAFALFGDVTMEHVMTDRRSDLALASNDVALLHLRSDGGLPISIGLDYVSRTPVRNVEIVGDAASARLDFIARSLTLTGPDGIIEVRTDGFSADDAYRLEIAELLDGIERGAATRLPLHEGLKATRVAIAADRAGEATRRGAA